MKQKQNRLMDVDKPVNNKQLFFLLIIICFGSMVPIVAAAPPDVNFTFTPTNPSSNQSILFNPDINFTGVINNIRWQFGSDGNTNSFRNQTTNINSSFDTNFEGWTVNQGSFSIVGNTLRSGIGVDSQIYHPITFPSQPFDLNVNTRMSLTSAGRTVFCFNEPSNAPLNAVCTNYGLWISSSSGNIELRYGTFMVIHTIQTGYVSGTLYDINMFRSNDGNYSFRINGSPAGSIVSTLSDMNGSFVQLGFGDGGGGNANFGYTLVTTGNNPNPDQNQTHTFTTGGVKNVCLTAGNNDGNKTTCNLVNVTSTPPVVDFTFTPTTASTGDPIVFNPSITPNGIINNLRWMFGTDGNTNYFAPPVIDIDQNETHVFTSNGVKNICLTAGNNDANVTICKTIMVAGLATIRVQDENTGLPISGASFTIDSNTITSGAAGDLNVFTDNITFPLTATLSKAGYDTRSFTFLSLSGMIQDSNLNLRYAPTTEDIQFQFYAPNQTTLLGNRIVVVTKNGGVSGRALTNINGIATLNLAPQDGNYRFLFYPQGTDFNLATIDYNYGAIRVTVNQARDESNNALITPNLFNIDVGGLGLQNFNSQSLPFSSILILGNTVDAYTLRVVDENSDGQQFFSRNYVLHATGDTNAISITPYLIDIDEGTLVNFRIVDIATNITIPNIRVTLSFGINNVLTVVEDTISDSAGIVQLAMLSQTQYILDVTSVNQDINYFSGTINPNVISVLINYSNPTSTFTPGNISYNIFPTTNTLSGTTQTIDVNVGTDFNVSSFIVQAIDNNRVVTSTQSSSNPFNTTLNLTLADFNSSMVIIRTIIVGFDQNTIINKTYIITSVGNGGVLNLVGLTDDLSPTNLLIFAFIALVGLIILMGPGISGNSDAQVFVGAIGLGLLVFLFFREFFLYAIGAVFAGAIAWMWTRSNR